MRFIFFMCVLSLTMVACAVTVPSATQSGPRTLILDDDKVSEAEVGGFTCWYCIRGGYRLVEVGFFDKPDTDLSTGFILYDNGFEGTRTIYRREGLNRRWDWGFDEDGFTYSFIVKPDGTGLYYDFGIADSSGIATPKDTYQCYKRKN